MPIYEYQCANCHHHFDLMQKISEAPVEQCPKCFENSVIKLISAAGFQLKGTGWYATDFKNKGGSNKETSSKPGLDKKTGASAATVDSNSKTPKQENTPVSSSSSKKGDA